MTAGIRLLILKINKREKNVEYAEVCHLFDVLKIRIFDIGIAQIKRRLLTFSFYFLLLGRRKESKHPGKKLVSKIK